MKTLSLTFKVASLGFALLASGAAWSNTIITVQSGPGSINTTNTGTAGTSANPWTITESITAISPFVLNLTNSATNPVGPDNSAGSLHLFAKWLSVTITNNTSSAWSSFDFELQSVLGTPSTDGDGLS